MKSLLKDEYLSSKQRLTSLDYDIGVFAGKATSKLRNKGYKIYTDELACQFQGVVSCINFLKEHEVFGSRIIDKEDDSSYEDRSGRDRWTEYGTYDKATEAMLKTPEKFRSFTEADIRLSDSDSVGNGVYFEHSGDFLDVGKFLEGEPECFGVMRDGRIQHRFCSIVVNGGASCNVDKETIALKAARTLRLVDALESNGVRCEVAVMFSTQELHAEIIVKHYNDPLDINDFAVALSPDFFRWVIFRLTEHSAEKTDGYGCPEQYAPKLWVDEDADNTIYVESLHDNNMSWMNDEFDSLEKKIKEGFEKGETYFVLK